MSCAKSAANQSRPVDRLGGRIGADLDDRELPARKYSVIRAMPNNLFDRKRHDRRVQGQIRGRWTLSPDLQDVRFVGEPLCRRKHMDAVTVCRPAARLHLHHPGSLAEPELKSVFPGHCYPAGRTNHPWRRQSRLETGDHPALLKDAVTTPAAATIDAIMELEMASYADTYQGSSEGDTKSKGIGILTVNVSPGQGVGSQSCVSYATQQLSLPTPTYR